jgi:tellurite resistance protein
MGKGTGDVSFDTEVIKLLLQVAWADDEVDPREKELIFGLARSWFVPEQELKVLMQRLDEGEPLPQPNLKMLRTRPDEVLEAARALVASDGKVAPEESQMLQQIQELLSGK